MLEGAKQTHMNRHITCMSFLAQAGLACWLMAFVGCTIIPQGVGDYDAGWKERGVASWYGEEFQGRLTASGKMYDQFKLTAAHRSLPLGSRIRVLNALNGRAVDVVINDRGPYVVGRIIDLSYAAAERLDMIDSGTSPVFIELLSRETEDPRIDAEETLLSAFGESTVLVLSMRSGGQFGTVWISPAGTSAYPMTWPHLGDLRDERRSRRLSQLCEEIPQPAPLPSGSLPEEYTVTTGQEIEPAAV